MGRKGDLIKARNACYKGDDDDEHNGPDPGAMEDDVDTAISYDCDTATMFRLRAAEFIEKGAYPIGEYLNDDAIYYFLREMM